MKIYSIIEKNADLLANLYFRWLDERDYEDLKDYKKVIEDNLRIEISAIKSRPFGFRTKCEEKEFDVQVNSKGILIKPVKKNN